MSYLQKLLGAADQAAEIELDERDLELEEAGIRSLKDPGHPAPLVGPDLDRMAAKTGNGINQARRQLEKIETEIERLEAERSKTLVVLYTYEAALKRLSEGANQEGLEVKLPNLSPSLAPPAPKAIYEDIQPEIARAEPA